MIDWINTKDKQPPVDEIIIGKYPFEIIAFKNSEQKRVVYAVPVYKNTEDYFAVLKQLKGRWVIDLI